VCDNKIEAPVASNAALNTCMYLEMALDKFDQMLLCGLPYLGDSYSAKIVCFGERGHEPMHA